MCNIKFSALEVDHIVEFSKDSTVIAAARENGNGHLRIFLIYENTGNVYTRNGRAESWEEISGGDKESVVTLVRTARNNRVTVYKINGSHN